ncbi:MAG: hypothetical protein M1127_03010 [Patescibacteria group bacterium]|nr:hypothetical protein [Patescibacteria group bacterium]
MQKARISQLHFLKAAVAGNCLPHALLFSGNDEQKKQLTAFELAKTLLCQSAEKPCTKCQNCLLADKRQHPDLIFVRPDNNEIKIEQVRDLRNFLSFKPALAGCQVIIIPQARLLNVQAQNCFLKTLEEPQGTAYFILIADLASQFLATIQSRCAEIKFCCKNEIKLSAKDRETTADFFKAPLIEKFLTAGRFFAKDSQSNKDVFVFLKNLIIYLREALLRALEQNGGAVSELKETTVRAEKTLYFMQNTNINQRLAMENLILKFS